MHHHTYRSPYSTNNLGVGSSSTNMVTSMSNSHLHSIGSPTSSTNTNTTNNRYHHHAPSDMDVVTAAAIGAAAAAQMFHHEKQSHHAYPPTTHHFDYHIGGSMMSSTPYGFPTQGKIKMKTNIRTCLFLLSTTRTTIHFRFRSHEFKFVIVRLGQYKYEGSDDLFALVLKSSFILSIIESSRTT